MDGSTTISPAEAQQPADTENFSALDQSSGSKGTENTSNAQENNEKSSEEKPTAIYDDITREIYIFAENIKPKSVEETI